MLALGVLRCLPGGVIMASASLAAEERKLLEYTFPHFGKPWQRKRPKEIKRDKEIELIAFVK